MDSSVVDRPFHLAPSQWIAAWRTLLLMSVAVAILGATVPIEVLGSSLLYKNYIVRYDRGWDILCEPYVVKEGDWVYKIFRQKGELSHADFRDFLGIFARLNPMVQNIDLLRPGQAVEIPLRKLEHGTLPGQATGIVTIPVVSLTKVEDLITEHSLQYQVQKGDTVSRLIAQRYGRVGTSTYQEGLKLFKAANTEVTDLNRIYAGQKLNLPDPSLRDQNWYGTLYDEQGNIKETVDAAKRPSTSSPQIGDIPSMPAALSDTQNPSVLASVAAVVGGKLRDKGTYYVPRQQVDDFEVDLSRHPMLEIQGHDKIIFTQNNDIMGMDRNTVQSFWPSTQFVEYDPNANPQQLVAAVLDAIKAPEGDEEEADGVAEAGFEDNGIRVIVTAKWIKPENEHRKLCITPINTPAEQTPEAFCRYLDQHGIVLKEVLPNAQIPTTNTTPPSDRHAVRNVLDLAAINRKELVQNLARAIGLTYAPNIGIEFPYAGIQIKAFSNLISAPNGQEMLVDFGDLYGDALQAIRKSGPQVLQIGIEESHTQVVGKILSGLKLAYTENPLFWAAQRSDQFNTAVTVTGFLLTPSPERKLLLTDVALPPAVIDLVSADGTEIVMW